MKKIQIEVCVGTTCYVMGASELMLIEEYLPTEQLDKIDVRGVTCLDVCYEKQTAKAPFVRIDGEILSNVNVEMLVSEIDKRLN